MLVRRTVLPLPRVSTAFLPKKAVVMGKRGQIISGKHMPHIKSRQGSSSDLPRTLLRVTANLPLARLSSFTTTAVTSGLPIRSRFRYMFNNNPEHPLPRPHKPHAHKRAATRADCISYCLRPGFVLDARTLSDDFGIDLMAACPCVW
jgi:hypothetical protein